MTGQFTLEAWVYLKSGGAYRHFINKERAGANQQAGYGLAWRPTNQVGFWIEGQDVGVTPANPFPYNEWHYVAAVYTGTTENIYIDGTIASSSAIPVNPVNGRYLTIGGYTDNNIYHGNMDGYIDEVRIYNRALSAEEIKTNYETLLIKSPSLTLTKSLSPSTITEGDSTTITIRVENTGGDAKSVKIADAIPQGFTLVSGSASQEYATLKATETRTFQYTVKATGTGRFVSDLATVIYQDDKGNSYSGASNSATITVQAGQAGQVPAAQPKTPGFGAILAGIGIILALAVRRR